MVAAKEVSRDAARDVLTKLVEDGGDPAAIVEREGLGAISADDGDGNGLVAIVDAAIAADPDAAAKVKEGNMKAIGPLVGYVMRETKGRADGGEVTRLIRERVGSQLTWPAGPRFWRWAQGGATVRPHAALVGRGWWDGTWLRRAA